MLNLGVVQRTMIGCNSMYTRFDTSRCGRTISVGNTLQSVPPPHNRKNRRARPDAFADMTIMQPFSRVEGSSASQMVQTFMGLMRRPQYAESSCQGTRLPLPFGLQMKWVEKRARSGPSKGVTKYQNGILEGPAHQLRMHEGEAHRGPPAARWQAVPTGCVKALLQGGELGRIQNRLIEDRVAFAAIGLDPVRGQGGRTSEKGETKRKRYSWLA